MKGLKRQSGVVLFFALILLVVMTVIGVALAVNAGQSLRMAGAGSERMEAKAAADGGLAAVMNATTAATLGSLSTAQNSTLFGGRQVLTPLPEGAPSVNVDCHRTQPANGTTFPCRRSEVKSSVTYGRDNMGFIEVTQGIEQEVLGGNGS
ncbi:pilus assembly PilX family protein [Shewanella dokdonensis]|uniref:pilus assembly PilX family protein n=1 Tax=Shewanella dokdonensis TaxID=712036 RepID=UPI00200E6008|nr:PilX N-terminal domain-containing pilus assembly protein [Shewanella dokdonensis]MCL1073612.1 pilus assembly PilX N-terminal domain-containing protein [Shewanella dokdonensis]